MGLYDGTKRKTNPRDFFGGGRRKHGGGGEAALKRAEASVKRAEDRAERNLAQRNKGHVFDKEPAGIRAAERGR